MKIVGRGDRNHPMLSEMKVMGDAASRFMRTQNAHPHSHRSFCLPVTRDIKTWHNGARIAPGNNFIEYITSLSLSLSL